MAVHNVASRNLSCNRRRALTAGAAAQLAMAMTPALLFGAAAAAPKQLGAVSDLVELERRFDALREKREKLDPDDLRMMLACRLRQSRLLERIIDAPMDSIDNARIKLRLALKAGCVDWDDPRDPIGGHSDEWDRHVANCIRSVLRYLDQISAGIPATDMSDQQLDRWLASHL